MKFQSKLIAACITSFLVVAASLLAEPSSSVKGEIIEFGIYKSLSKKTITENPDAPGGTRTTSKEIEFTEHTDRIPATKGVSFGIRYKLTGLGGQDSVALKKVVKHPPFKNKKGEMENQYFIELTRKPKDGSVISSEGYTLGVPGDLVPGTWTFEIWYHDQKMVSQSFTVGSPAETKKN